MPEENPDIVKNSGFIDKRAIDFISGLVAGTFCAGVFHPVDRAHTYQLKKTVHSFLGLILLIPTMV